MNLRNRLSLLVACAISSAALAHAHPPDADGHHRDPADIRAWTNARTGEAVRGYYLASRTGEVSIEAEDGKVTVLPLADLTPDDRAEAKRKTLEAVILNERLRAAMQPAKPNAIPAPGSPNAKSPTQAEPFNVFAPFVKTRWDDQWLYVESDGLPHAPMDHPRMVGIKSWQQQVPLPQAYTGDNAWRIPLKPEFAEKPISAKTELRRGAIALAANGVPIFNALNNRGDDAFKVGELDDFGGHSGRADDYHYHVAPLALQKVVGHDKPIAYALDGFPIYGLFDPAAKPGTDKACPHGCTHALDEFNGHRVPGTDGAPDTYHYHASLAYPYINGGMRGKVRVVDDQIEPQPRATPVRQWLQPLRGASITGFKTLNDHSWSLEYTVAGKKSFVNFRIENGKYIFDFVDAAGKTTTETYTPRPGGERRGGQEVRGRNRPDDQNRNDRPRRNRDQPRDGDNPPPRNDPKPADQSAPTDAKPSGSWVLKSASMNAAGELAAECTCDGARLSPALEWADPPAGTRFFAVTIHHIPPSRAGEAPEDKHVYLVLANLPAATRSIAKGAAATSGGVLGVNTVNRRAEYAPPCSKGPGKKTYTVTLYALSSEAAIPSKAGGGPTMDELLVAIKDTTLGKVALDVTYEHARTGSGSGPGTSGGQPR